MGSNENHSAIGNGIEKTSSTLIKVHVDDSGEYWLCDAAVPAGSDYAKHGCTPHSSIQMAEGG